jgi:UDP-N-acetylmuramate-alanine ligase
VGDLAGVSGLDVARAAADRAGGRRVLWAPTLDRALAALRRDSQDGAIVVTLGAGDVHRVGERLVEEAA